jgi:hypothetical protein
MTQEEEKEILKDIKQARKEVAEGNYIVIKSDSLEKGYAEL